MTEVHDNLQNSTCDTLKYTMGSHILIVSIFMGKSSKIQRVNGPFIFVQHVSCQVYCTILILEKFTSLSSVISGVPSSMNDRSVRYIPRYGIQGGSHLQMKTYHIYPKYSAITVILV